jgi:hypothetical protein
MFIRQKARSRFHKLRTPGNKESNFPANKHRAWRRRRPAKVQLSSFPDIFLASVFLRDRVWSSAVVSCTTSYLAPRETNDPFSSREKQRNALRSYPFIHRDLWMLRGYAYSRYMRPFPYPGFSSIRGRPFPAQPRPGPPQSSPCDTPG